MAANVSIGITGRIDLDIVRALAPRVESLGFHALWVNDIPGGDSLAALRVAAEATTTLGLATGVIPLDRRPADTLDLDGIPADRLVLGVGSGDAAKALGLVREGVAALRSRTDAPIVVGALGPRMRRLGATDADGVVLNWLTPEGAADAVADLRRDAVGRAVRGVLYVRTITSEDARPTLEGEAARYETVPAYAANFERQGIRGMDATLDLALDPGRLDAYRETVDEIVLRPVTPHGTRDELLAFAEAAAN